MLQAWALKTVLERMGHTVEFPCGPYNEVGRVPWGSALRQRARSGSLARRVRSFVYRLLKAMLGMGDGVRVGKYYDAFRNKYLPERFCKVSDFSAHYDLIVLGSDQVINPRINGWSPYFLCCDMPVGISRIAYAVSKGDAPLSLEDAAMVKAALATFKSVSTREPFSNYTVVLDPVLLLQQADYDEVFIPSHKRDFIYMYSCDATNWEVKVAKELAFRLHLDLVITPTWGRYRRANWYDFSDLISPGHMIGYIRSAQYVLAGSFHGTALALLHGKPFLNLRPQNNSSGTRVMALLDAVGERKRVVNPSLTIEEIEDRLVRPLSESTAESLAMARARSLKWLEDALHSCSA